MTSLQEKLDQLLLSERAWEKSRGLMVIGLMGLSIVTITGISLAAAGYAPDKLFLLKLSACFIAPGIAMLGCGIFGLYRTRKDYIHLQNLRRAVDENPVLRDPTQSDVQ